jgi:hypothetical protein
MTDSPMRPPRTPLKRKPRQPSKGGEADPEQYARFVKAARELECDDDPAAFDRMFERIMPPKRKADEPAENETGEKRKRRPR